MATVCHTDEETIEAAHHKFQRRLLGISWKDKVKNYDIRKNTVLRKLEDIIKERRLRWLGHVIRMEDSRIPHQATQWELKGYKRKPRRDWTTKDKLDGHHETQPD